MIVKQFTDEQYIAMSDISNLDPKVVREVELYRQAFIEMVQINELDFVNIVETPSLIRKRYSKNVEIKGKVQIEAKSNDFILEMAKMLVNGSEIPGVEIKNKELLMKKYLENKKDLTIVTNYIINNLDKVIVEERASKDDIDLTFPELSLNDIEFLKTHNDIRLNYSISHYQKVTGCSYETGRKSLEKMMELDFYKKTKVGKKFIYKPTKKLKELIEGGG